MRILGVNASHDASVCVINDGVIEFYAKEERFNRIKRSGGVTNCLRRAHEVYGSTGIDYAVYAWEAMTGGFGYCESEKEIRKLFGLTYKEPRPFCNSTAFQHHDNHASIAFYNSGFEEAIVFVCDRNGSIFFIDVENQCREADTVYHCSYPNNFKVLEKKFWTIKNNSNLIRQYMEPYLNSLGVEEYSYQNMFSLMRVYESATTMIGQHPLENGKTMGLSSYGEDKRYLKLFDDDLNVIDQHFQKATLENVGTMEVTCFRDKQNDITHDVTPENYQKYANWAKNVQLETQRVALETIKKHVERTGVKNVCISGGFGLNIVANANYLKNLPDVNFYFEPLSDDSGIGIGAAMHLYRQLSKDTKIVTPKDNFYHHYTEKSLDDGIGEEVDIDKLTDLLIDQKSIAIFEGNPESGPRALGHRSILFDARSKNGKEIINKLKNREWYRPFAGIILESFFEEYFHTMELIKSEYMTVNFDCKDGVKNVIPTIVHVDNTCRIQSVSRENKFLYNLLSNFYKKTGCPILLNTSFNLAGKPLIQTKKDALNFIDEVDCPEFAGVYFVDDGRLVQKINNFQG
jgi:carbamoyltransferase